MATISGDHSSPPQGREFGARDSSQDYRQANRPAPQNCLRPTGMMRTVYPVGTSLLILRVLPPVRTLRLLRVIHCKLFEDIVLRAFFRARFCRVEGIDKLALILRKAPSVPLAGRIWSRSLTANFYQPENEPLWPCQSRPMLRRLTVYLHHLILAKCFVSQGLRGRVLADSAKLREDSRMKHAGGGRHQQEAAMQTDGADRQTVAGWPSERGAERVRISVYLDISLTRSQMRRLIVEMRSRKGLIVGPVEYRVRSEGFSPILARESDGRSTSAARRG